MRNLKSRGSQSGVALLTAMIIVIIVAGMAAAFLTLSFSQSKLISNGSEGEVALHIAEAGVEDMINKLTAYSKDWIKAGNVDPTYATAKPDYSILAQNAATITTTGKINGGTFTTTLSSTTAGSTDAYTGPFSPTAPVNGYLIVSKGTFNGVSRTVQIVTKAVNNNGMFNGGLFGDVEVDALGTFFSDGYNSKNGDYSSQKKQNWVGPDGKTYSYVDATGSIGSNGNIVTNGSATIIGNSTPGPGGTSGPGGNVFGSTAPATATTPLTVETYTVPATALPATFVSGTGMSLGVTGTQTTYSMDSLKGSGKGTITISGNVTLYVSGDFTMNNQMNLQIADGAKLTLIQTTGNYDMTINGNAMAGTQSADRFQIKSNTTGSVKFNGASTVYAYMYAPQATFTNNGGNEFFGAMTAKSMKLSGTASFHYDENLQNLATPIPDFKIVSWVEIPNQ